MSANRYGGMAMWFVGLVIGLVLGGLANGYQGALFGAALGAALGLSVSLLGRKSNASALEARVQALEAAVQELRSERSSPMPATIDFPTVDQVRQSEEPPAAQPAAAEALQDSPMAAEPPSEAPTPMPPAHPPVLAWLWNWWTGGNALVRSGVVVLFFGVAFLLKYAYERTQVPIEMRLTLVALGACVMLAVGWRLRTRKPTYALALQGGGVGLLYLTVFGAFRLFALLPAEAAFALLLAIAVASALLAVMQNAQSLAVLAVSGGFLAPVLASTGSGSHVLLFSYYAVLNLGILCMALYRAWRPLNVLGFVFTFAIGTLWGARFYRDELFASTEPFLVLFFLMYLAIAVIFALRQAPRLANYVDGTLVFGTPLIGFGLQARLVSPFEYGAAWSALAVAAVYLVLAASLYRRHRESLRMLVEAFLALGVIFVTLCIPLAVDGRWTSAAWALEGAAAYWVGVRQARRAPRVFGLLLQFAAGVAFLTEFEPGSAEVALFNTFYMGTVFIALAGLFSNWTIERHARQVGHGAMQAAMAVFVWGLAWWVFGGLHEIHVHVPHPERNSVALLFLAASAAVFSTLFARGWWIARFPALALTAIIALVLTARWLDGLHPLAGYGLLAWPIAFLLHFLILRGDDRVRDEQPAREVPSLQYLPWAHALGVWLLALAGAWELAWQIDRVVNAGPAWSLAGWALVPAMLLASLGSRSLRGSWLMERHREAYLWRGAAPVVAFVLLWSVYAAWRSNGDPVPLPYVPLLNPLDIAQLLVFAAIIMWARALASSRVDAPNVLSAPWTQGLLGSVLFLWANAVLLRTLHHWADVPYHLEPVLRSDLAQTALSIFWTLIALGMMVFATRGARRALWLIGAGLMAVVVLKLFLIDLAKVNGVERIVSFMAVGVLMLVIGYFSPVPPRRQAQPT